MADATKKTRLRLGLLGLAAAALLVGCARDLGPHPELPFIGIVGEYTSQNLCGLGETPELKLYGVPAGAAVYRVSITNVGVLQGPNWRADVRASGPVIAAGALVGVPNPCPPEVQNYAYRFEIMALAADGRPLGYGWNFINVPSLTRRLDAERQTATRPAAAAPRSPESLRPSFFIY